LSFDAIADTIFLALLYSCYSLSCDYYSCAGAEPFLAPILANIHLYKEVFFYFLFFRNMAINLPKNFTIQQTNLHLAIAKQVKNKTRAQKSQVLQ
jgi:hypothetical protein